MEDRWIRRQSREETWPEDQSEPIGIIHTEQKTQKDMGIAAGDSHTIESAQHAISELLSSLEAVLRTEHQVLLERDAGALTTLARQKMALLATLERSSGNIEPAAVRAWLDEDRATVAALARCRGLNHINGTLLALRREQVGHGLDALGISMPQAEPEDAPYASGADQGRDDPQQAAAESRAVPREDTLPSSQDACLAEGNAPRRTVQHLA